MFLLDLSPDEKNIFTSRAGKLCLETGGRLITEGQDGNSLYFLEEGLLEVFKQIDERHVKRLAFVKPGEFFGELSFLGIAPRSASVAAVERSEVLEMTSDGFAGLSRDYPGLAFRIYEAISRGLAAKLANANEDIRQALVMMMEGVDY